jgi:hypothetical protein
MPKEIIELPKGPYVDLADICSLRTAPLDANRSQILLTVLSIPPSIASRSAEAWEIADYLKDVQELLLAAIWRGTWIYERDSSQCIQIVPHWQVIEQVDRLIAVLTEITDLYPVLLGLVWEQKACWEENREKGLARTISWVEELGYQE